MCNKTCLNAFLYLSDSRVVVIYFFFYALHPSEMQPLVENWYSLQ